MNANNPLAAYFKGIPLFARLGPEDLNEVLRSVKMVSLRAGQSVFEEGDASDGLYLVMSGRFEVFSRLKSGKQMTLTEIGPNEFFGELALLDREPRSATVRAVEDSELVKIDAKEFDYLRQNYSPAAYKLIREIAILVCARLRRINNQILDVLNPEPVPSEPEETPRLSLFDRLISLGRQK